MTAREKLVKYVEDAIHFDNWPSDEEIVEVRKTAEKEVDAFAHELAEQIRNSEELRDLTDDHMGDCYAAADLIDPGLIDD